MNSECCKCRAFLEDEIFEECSAFNYCYDCAELAVSEKLKDKKHNMMRLGDIAKFDVNCVMFNRLWKMYWDGGIKMVKKIEWII